MSTTTITTAQIETLRTEAATAGDWVQSAICDIALDGKINDADAYECLTTAERRRLSTMDQDAATAECERVIADVAAQVGSA